MERGKVNNGWEKRRATKKQKIKEIKSMQMMLEKQTCIEPAIEVVLKSPITSLFKYDFRSKKLEFDDDESIDAEEFTGAQPNEC